MNPTWQLSHPRNSDSTVDIYRIPLDTPPLPLASLREILSAEEQARAARFYFERDRRRYQVARGMLRVILGAVVGQPPASLAFGYGAHGKPYLTHPHSDGQFNIAHSGEVALLGVTQGYTIGVDVEEHRPLPDMAPIVTQFFTAEEQSAILTRPAAEREDAFYAAWTRKEAYLKALGSGLARPLNDFTVAIPPNAPPRLLWVRDAPAEPSRWHFWHLDPATGYSGAVCVALMP
jgi:4'-phosphopantetheinyl transferase